MPEITTRPLLSTPTVRVRDVYCLGGCRHQSPQECAMGTHLVFPYRGVFMRHVASDDSVADVNQVLFFNDGQDYTVSHPVAGGDACLSISIDPSRLLELAPREQLHERAVPIFRQQRRRIDSRAQVLLARLRQALQDNGQAQPLETEVLSIELLRNTLGPRATTGAKTQAKTQPRTASQARQRLVDSIKLLLTSSDPARRWTLADIASASGWSPVYLTQAFQQAEGMPLYRYQTQLRLARALDLISQYSNLTALALDLGFSSHSHFSAAFRQAYGLSPSQFQQSARRRS